MTKLLSKVKRKLGQILVKVVPYNQSLRPHVTAASSKEYFEGKKIQGYGHRVIYPGYAFCLQLPPALWEAAERFEKLTPEMTLPDVVVVSVPEGRLYTDTYSTIAIMSSDNALLHDISLELRTPGELAPFVNHIFKLRYFNQPRKFKGTVFTLLTGGGGLDNYFHWLFDVLPRLHLLRESGLYHDVDWFLIPNYKFPYQKDTLRLLDIPVGKVIDGSTVTHLQADRVIGSSPHRNAGQMEDWACRYLRTSFIPKVTGGSKSPARIYITRNDSRSRNVINEAELISYLKPYGFETVSLSGMSFLDQVSLFNNARIIVSPHGAGLANLVFCEPGTRIIELFSEGWIGTMYYDLAQKLGLDYSFNVARLSNPPRTAAEAKHKHFEIDISVVDAIMRGFPELQK